MTLLCSVAMVAAAADAVAIVVLVLFSWGTSAWYRWAMLLLTQS